MAWNNGDNHHHAQGKQFLPAARKRERERGSQRHKPRNTQNVGVLRGAARGHTVRGRSRAVRGEAAARGEESKVVFCRKVVGGKGRREGKAVRLPVENSREEALVPSRSSIVAGSWMSSRQGNRLNKMSNKKQRITAAPRITRQLRTRQWTQQLWMALPRCCGNLYPAQLLRPAVP